jgi:hypothetical protein
MAAKGLCSEAETESIRRVLWITDYTDDTDPTEQSYATKRNLSIRFIRVIGGWFESEQAGRYGEPMTF